MKSPYVAKSAHKMGCSFCGYSILPGDLVAAWCWVCEDPPPMGGIARVHFSCNEIAYPLDVEFYNVGCVFVDADEHSDEKDPTKSYQARAAVALADARARPVAKP